MSASLTIRDLKAFQTGAAGQLLEMLTTFPSEMYPAWYDSASGRPFPFVGRLQAVTGSGKTPILALCAAGLENAIILWTTNRGAVISQTAAKLSAGGSYAQLLPESAEIKEFSNLSSMDWDAIVNTETGLTIILSTVAAYNQEGDKLKIHQKRGDTSHWEMLSGQGSEGRKRPLYVFYDEGHGVTTKQFRKLIELAPKAFVLASASPLPSDLHDLIPGRNNSEKEEALKKQTALVRTSDVVAEGLLKTRLYFVDCHTTRRDALSDANEKWLELSQKLARDKEWPVMCCIVNGTREGLEVWSTLTQELNIDPTRVAVHLANVEKAIGEANLNVPWHQLIDTHRQKKSPEDLHNEGYTHIIWNLSLREGWDEPWAYVAYLDGVGHSAVDITQKIGRFLRQPNATPFADQDLNSAYFYFNVPDEDFKTILEDTRRGLEHDGYEIITLSKSDPKPKSSRMVSVKNGFERKIPKVGETFGEDLDALDNIVLKHIPLFDSADLNARGRVTTVVIDTKTSLEDDALRKEETRVENAEIIIWDYLIARLADRDSRIAKKNQSTRFSGNLKNHARLKQKMQFGSPAMETISRNITHIVQELNSEFRLEYDPDEEYNVQPFNLVSPDLQVENPLKREQYKVRQFSNALHEEYNNLNAFELEIASALDLLGNPWCRNPSQIGYAIPIPFIGEGTKQFFPDFLMWTSDGKTLWAIDPKGRFIANDAIHNKLMGLTSISNMPIKVRVALALEGQYEIGTNHRPVKVGPDGYTLITQNSTGVKAKTFASPTLLVRDLRK